MSGSDRDSPNSGGGYEPWRSLYRDQWTIALCKEIWRRDYGEEIPETILSSLHQDEGMILTNFILDSHAQRCGAQTAAMYPRPHSAISSMHKRQPGTDQTNDRRTSSSAAPTHGRSRNDTQVNDRNNCENSPTPLELAASSLLDIIKLKARWRRQFEAETNGVDKSNNAMSRQLSTSPTPGTSKSHEDKPVSRHIQKETDGTDSVMNTGKTKKAVRFLTDSPDIIESQSISKQSENSAENAEKIEDAKIIADGRDGVIKTRKTKKAVRFKTSSPDVIETHLKSPISKVYAEDVEKSEDAKKEDDSSGTSIKTRKTKKAVRFMADSPDANEFECKSQLLKVSAEDVETGENAKKEDVGSDDTIKSRKTRKSVRFLTNSPGFIEPDFPKDCAEDGEKIEYAKLIADVPDSAIHTSTRKKAVRFLTNSPEGIEPVCTSQKFQDYVEDKEKNEVNKINADGPDVVSKTKTSKRGVRFLMSSPEVIEPLLKSKKSQERADDEERMEDATRKVEGGGQDRAIKTRKKKKAVKFMTSSPEVIESELKSHKPRDCPEDEQKSDDSMIGSVGSNSAIKTRKTKKAVRFLTCSPEVVEFHSKSHKSMDFVEDKEHIENDKKKAGGLDSANKTSNSIKAVGFLTCAPEVIESRTNLHGSTDCVEDKIKDISITKKHTVRFIEKSNAIGTSKRKQNVNNGNQEAAVSSKKKNKVRKKKRVVYTRKKKKHQRRDNASLGLHKISPSMGLDNINDEEADIEVASIMRNAGAPTVGPFRVYGLKPNKTITPYPQTQTQRKPAGTPFLKVYPKAEEPTSTQVETDRNGTTTKGTWLHYDNELPSTSKQHPTCTAGTEYIDASADSKVANWLLHHNATQLSSSSGTPVTDRDQTSSSSSLNMTPMSPKMRSPYFIDGETGEAMPFGPPIRMVSEPPETAIPVLALLPWRDGRRHYPDRIKVVGGIDFDNSPVLWTKPQAKDTHDPTQTHETDTIGEFTGARKRMYAEDGLEAAVMSKKKSKRDEDFLKKKPLKLTIKKKTNESLQKASYGVQNSYTPQDTILHPAAELPSTSHQQPAYLDIATEPLAADNSELPQWPSRRRQQPEFQPISVADGIDVGNSPTNCGRPQTKATDVDQANNM